MANRYAKAFREFLDVWLTQRSLEGVRAMMDPQATGFGTGMHEVAFQNQLQEMATPQAVPHGVTDLVLFEEDIRSAPAPIQWHIREMAVQELNEGAVVVMAMVDLSTLLLDQAVRFNGIRITMVFADGPDGLRIRHDHFSFPTQVHGDQESYPLKELEERLESFERLLQKRTRTLQEAYAELSRVANTDRLTGIASRTRLDEVLAYELPRHLRYGSLFSVLFFDINRFKQINDTSGHQEGDRVLVQVAQALSKASRVTDTVGRWGGDEFMAILPETDRVAAQELAERLVECVGTMHSAEGTSIGISIGLTEPLPDDTVHSLFNRVDAAMYADKSKWKG